MSDNDYTGYAGCNCGAISGERHLQTCRLMKNRATYPPPKPYLPDRHSPGWGARLDAEEAAFAAKAKEAVLPTDPAARKGIPLATGLLDYFPDALMEVANVSRVGNEQHNPGEPLHWAKDKSTDEADSLMRHLIDRGTLDTDGIRHTAKVAWRALALLQREIESER